MSALLKKNFFLGNFWVFFIRRVKTYFAMLILVSNPNVILLIYIQLHLNLLCYKYSHLYRTRKNVLNFQENQMLSLNLPGARFVALLGFSIRYIMPYDWMREKSQFNRLYTRKTVISGQNQKTCIWIGPTFYNKSWAL